MPVLRLDKILSDLGIASRREAKAMIREGRVTVGGITATLGSMKLDTQQNDILVDGKRILYQKNIYLMLNKPSGYISAAADAKDPTVMDLLGPEMSRFSLFPVGRLDKNTEGLLILTNDGDYSHKITSPKYGIVKTYYVEADGKIKDGTAALFREGLALKDGTQFLPAELEVLSSGAVTTLLLKITEGQYHQVKRMMAAVGCPVRYLKRLSIGGLHLDDSLLPGKYRRMAENEYLSVFDNVAL
ncbi:MAG: rRNA pseudouridine synthase [Clostridiales bacterium]|jgi:16S rRNA pseudouridine516 synthase|nr:rRNA pseudouridine synthase [Clostridiales bacterium]